MKRHTTHPGSRRERWLAAALVLCASMPLVFATDLGLRVEATLCDSASIVVGTGCETGYRVVGELGDTGSDGLAMFVFDLEFDGGDLLPADTPAGLPLAGFAPPAGLANPAGFGGTAMPGKLLQVGGAQNVVRHGSWDCESDADCPAPATCSSEVCSALPGLPLGTPVRGVAQRGNPTVLATGRLTVPLTPGTYTLRIVNPVARVVERGAFGQPFWQNEPAGTGPIEALTIAAVEGAACCDGFEGCCLPAGGCAMTPPAVCIDQHGGSPLGPTVSCEGDLDGDGRDAECGDACPDDPSKTEEGVCGCGVADSDGDADSVPDCVDKCPGENDSLDVDGDGTPDCQEQAVPIPVSTVPGLLLMALLLVGAHHLVFGRNR